jgi:hypothetical protein
LRTLSAEPALAARLRAGQQAALAALAGPHTSGERARVLGFGGELVAVIVGEGGRWKLERVFRDPSPCAP